MNANRLTTPKEKVQELQEKLGHAAKINRKRRFHALYDKVYRLDVLQEAWRRVRSNRGAAGVDKQTLQDIDKMGAYGFLLACQKCLKEGTYRPLPVRRKNIPKKDGKMRPLGIPTVRDRVIQMASKLVLEPIFEADFQSCSFGFRPGKNAKQALERVRKACNRRGYWVVDADIQGYFDNINQEKLLKLVEIRISDRRVMKLIRQWLKAGVMEEGNIKHSELGIPQGGVISPLLANIYLNYFDKLWGMYGAGIGELTRYADDFVIVCQTRKNSIRAYGIVQAIMKRLELTMHPTKTRLVSMGSGEQGFDFLGMHHRRSKEKTFTGQTYYTTQQWLTKKAAQHIRDVVKERLAPPWARVQSLESHIEYLNPKIRGWKNYYATKYGRPKMAKLDWYIIARFSRWWATKTKRARSFSAWRKVAAMVQQHGLLKMA